MVACLHGKQDIQGSSPSQGENFSLEVLIVEYIQIKLLIEEKLIICALGNLHYQISREKFEPEPGFEQIGTAHV